MKSLSCTDHNKLSGNEFQAKGWGVKRTQSLIIEAKEIKIISKTQDKKKSRLTKEQRQQSIKIYFVYGYGVGWRRCHYHQ